MSVFNGTLDELRAFAQADVTPSAPIAIGWRRAADGHYDLSSTPGADVVRVDYFVDGQPVGSAARKNGATFAASYTFTNEGDARLFEARGFDVNNRYVARGAGLLDVTAAPAEVAAIEVRVDGILLQDGVSGTSHSARKAVRSSILTSGSRRFALSTYNANGALRGTLYRTFTIAP